ncbi:MAG TPA: class I SAM-dependent methyltransferase [Natronosporangium sp.]
MTIDPYADPDLVALYDLDNPGGEDHDYYRALADQLDARVIIDLGCGTGLLTRTLVRPGRTVVGVDPSRTMLDYARRQPGAGAVTWVQGDASVLAPAGTADLVICTGNAFQHITPAELAGALAAVAGALRPGGVFSFETRNPAYRQWEEWTPEATYGERDTHVGRLREWLEVTEVSDGRVVFEAHNVFPDGEDRVYRSTLFFRTASELAEALTAAGFDEVAVAGDWRGGPLTDASRVLVVRATRAGAATR